MQDEEAYYVFGYHVHILVHQYRGFCAVADGVAVAAIAPSCICLLLLSPPPILTPTCTPSATGKVSSATTNLFDGGGLAPRKVPNCCNFSGSKRLTVVQDSLHQHDHYYHCYHDGDSILL